MGKVAIITSLNQSLLTEYGGKTVAAWPGMTDADLYLCSEDQTQVQGFIPLGMPYWQQAFKFRHRDNPFANGRDVSRNRDRVAYDFRLDAVRFSHKVGAIFAARGCTDDDTTLIWIDADVEFIQRVDSDWLLSLLPEPYPVGWLQRDRVYPECGFLMFRGAQGSAIIRDVARLYQTDGVYAYCQTHDSHIFNKVVSATCDAYNIAGDASRHHDVFRHSQLSKRMRHHKGNRKWNLKHA